MIFISERNPIDLQQWFLQVNVPPVSQIHSQREALSRLPNADPSYLGMPPCKKSAVFLNIVQKAFDPPPLLFEHLSYFAGGVF